jgi:phosphatidylglycerol:prolipoprotein diacylglycerol transferase
MYPELFHIGSFTIYSYGFFIMMGTLLAYFYAVHQAKKIDIQSEKIAEMIVYIFIASFVGGKVFLWFSDWNYYMQNPSKMIELSGSGFVFYGSFIFSIITLLLFFKHNKINRLAMFDIIAIGATFVHGLGKIGCFLAGCCNGKICSASMGVIYSNPLSKAIPLNTSLYPVQLYDAAIIFSCTLLLLFLKSKNRFQGKLILVYAIFYSVGRFFTEFLRGDEDRGFIFNGLLSQSQFFSIIIIIVSMFFLFKKQKLKRFNINLLPKHHI